MSSIGPSDDLQDWINGLAEQLAEARNERDAAIAALGDVDQEPLEDMVRELGDLIEITIMCDRTGCDASLVDEAQVSVNHPWPEPLAIGTGPTIDAAVRNAIARARGEI